MIYTYLNSFKYSYLMLIIHTQSYDFNYSYQTLIIYTQLYGFKQLFYLIGLNSYIVASITI